VLPQSGLMDSGLLCSVSPGEIAHAAS